MPSLEVLPPFSRGCGAEGSYFGRLLWLGAQLGKGLTGDSLPTTAVPLRAHAPSVGLQHVYLLPPLLLFLFFPLSPPLSLLFFLGIIACVCCVCAQCKNECAPARRDTCKATTRASRVSRVCATRDTKFSQKLSKAWDLRRTAQRDLKHGALCFFSQHIMTTTWGHY